MDNPLESFILLVLQRANCGQTGSTPEGDPAANILMFLFWIITIIVAGARGPQESEEG